MSQETKPKKPPRTVEIKTSLLGWLGGMTAVGLLLVMLGFFLLPDTVLHRGYLTFDNDWEYYGFTRAIVENNIRTTDYEIKATDPLTGRPDVVYIEVVLDRDAEFYYGSESVPRLNERLGAGGMDSFCIFMLVMGWALLFVVALSIVPGIFWGKWYTHTLKLSLVPLEQTQPTDQAEGGKADGQ